MRPRTRAGGESRGDATTEAKIDADVRVLRLRMQGVIDRMQAGVVRIDELGITLREIETGLIDFPALASGRQIWLCWRLGEGDVEWWHELERRVRRPAGAGRPDVTDRPAVASGSTPPPARRRLVGPAGPSSRAAGRRRTGRSRSPTAAAPSTRRSPPTSGATSSRPTSCSSRPGWAPTISPSGSSTRA